VHYKALFPTYIIKRTVSSFLKHFFFYILGLDGSVLKYRWSEIFARKGGYKFLLFLHDVKASEGRVDIAAHILTCVLNGADWQASRCGVLSFRK
jgi:hypothetical protein